MSMRRILVLLVAGVLLAACTLPSVTMIRGSGNTTTQTYDFSGFDSLIIGSAFQAEVVMSETYEVEVTVDDNLVEHLRVEQRGDTVAIGLKPNTGVTNVNMRARVALPNLVSLDASGATTVDLTGFKSGENMRMNVSGASTVKGDMESGDMSTDVSGASTLRLNGRGDSLRAVASGASTIDLSDFAVTDANVEASGASRINVNASGTLNAEAGGASTVRYSGNPTLGRIDDTGASTIAPE